MMAMKIELIHTDQSTIIGEDFYHFCEVQAGSLDQR